MEKRVGGRFTVRFYRGKTDSVTMVIPRLSRYYHGKTEHGFLPHRFYRGNNHGFWSVITRFFTGSVLPWYYHGNTTVKPYGFTTVKFLTGVVIPG